MPWPLEVRLLGPLSVTLRGDTVAIPGIRSQAILVYLCMRRGVDVPRETLAGLLWPDRSDGQARGSLRQALSALRKALGDRGSEVLNTTNATVSLDPASSLVDVDGFREPHGDGRDPEDLYNGDLLEGFGAVSPAFDRWLESERSALRAAFIRTLTGLMQTDLSSDRPERGIARATRLIEIDPLQEHVHRSLMEAQARLGRHDAALRQYENLVEILERDLGVRPEAQTLDLYDRIRSLRRKKAEKGEPVPRGAPPVVPSKPSLAVLPFDYLSPDDDAAYIGEGIAEDIIIELSKSGELFVVARQSSFAAAAREQGLSEIGRILGVRYALAGSIRRSGGRIRVSAHLARCDTEEELWADRYDRELRDIFDVQTEISRTVTGTVIGRITEISGVTERARRTDQISAYDLVLRGIRALHRYSASGLAEARSCFLEASALDPDYARPVGLLALTDMYQTWYLAISSDVTNAMATGEAALSLDPNDAKAHLALGLGNLISHRHAQAGDHFERSLAINPNDDLALVEYGRYLMYIDRSAEGIRKVREAMRLNPFHPDWYWNIHGRCLHTMERYEDAIASFQRVVRPQYFIFASIAACHAMLGDNAAAKLAKEKLYAARPDFRLRRFEGVFPYSDPKLKRRFFSEFKAAGID